MSIMPGWIVTPIEGDESHVLPIDDAAPHLRSESCPCRPRVAPVIGPRGQRRRVVVHDAFDGRQVMERALAEAREIITVPDRRRS